MAGDKPVIRHFTKAMTLLVALASMGFAAPTGACAKEAATRGSSTLTLKIEDLYTHPTLAGATRASAYLTIINTGPVDDTLLAASGAIAGKVEIHNMVMDGDVMRMRKVDSGLAISKYARTRLRPGGQHLMLMQLKHPLRAHEIYPLELIFKHAGSISVDLNVVPRTSKPVHGLGH